MLRNIVIRHNVAVFLFIVICTNKHALLIVCYIRHCSVIGTVTTLVLCLHHFVTRTVRSLYKMCEFGLIIVG